MVQGRVLVIAGSDSSGGAGLEADQKVIAAHGCYAMTATTALTAQNTQGVKGIHVIPAEFVAQQIEACIEDVGVDVVKTGMLAAADTIEMVSRMVTKHKIPVLVVDPVMVSTSGAQLLPHEAIKQLSQHLLPHTTVLTPNIPEAALVLAQNGRPEVDIRSPDDLETVAREIHALGPKWVLVKGGHRPFKEDLTVAETEEERKVVVDVLVGGDGEVFRVKSPYQSSTSTHGTGCSLAWSHPDGTRSRQRTWPSQPLPLDLHVAILTVSAGAEASIQHPDTRQGLLPRVPSRAARRQGRVEAVCTPPVRHGHG
ncbi:uncharacterized protein AUP68_17656 [Ilyonectria robusta]